jgi:cell division protein FtsQ
VIEDEQNRNHPPQWEDEAPEEPRFRRMRKGVPPDGRTLPGMPLEMEEAEDDDLPRSAKPRFTRAEDSPRGPWWRPASSWGRGLLAASALTVAVGLGVASYALHNFLAHDARFRIAGLGNIEANGLSEVSRADVLPVFGEDIGKNIFFVSLRDRRQQLEQLPWVERATVMRLLPDRIRVQVVERQPVAFVRQGSQIGLVDANGVLLSMPPAMMAQRHYSFPVVTGIKASDSPGARRQRMALYQQLIRELDSDGHGISHQISEIDLSNPDDVKVMLPDAQGEILAHFGDDHFLERYQRYTGHIAEWRAQYPRLAGVDLRYESKDYLEMKPAAAEEMAANVPKNPAETPNAGQAQANPAAQNSGGRQDRKAESIARAPAKPVHDPEAKAVRAAAHPARHPAKAGVKLNKKQKPEAHAAKTSAEKNRKPAPGTGESSHHHGGPTARPALDPVLGQ